ncbi:DUF2808 domain-containing protein [Nostoc sp.]|uniref:DUF2808 domain-containing protein n=1 Tax=Nostoc sp. TaxID=1180 RepID=UPI002FF73F05
MKRLIVGSIFTLVFASLASVTLAAPIPFDAKTPYVVHGDADPNDAFVQDATHDFELRVEGKAVSQLSIHIPEGITVGKGIEIVDQSGKNINAQVAYSNRTFTAAFSQPVTPGTTLTVSLKGIKNSGEAQALVYPVSFRGVGMTTDIPLRSVIIQTYGM